MIKDNRKILAYEEQLKDLGLFSGEKEAQGIPDHSLQLRERRLQPGGSEPLLPDTNERARRHSLKLQPRRFRLNFSDVLMGSFVKHCNGLPREVIQLPSIEVLKKQLGVGLSAKVQLPRS